jgi:transposase InsO family protein
MGRIPDHVRQLVIDWPEDADRGAVVRFCADHGVSRSWFYQVRRRAAAQGQAALVKDSRRPRSSPGRTSQYLRKALLATREKLKSQGKDYGPLSVLFALRRQEVSDLPSRATVARIFDQADVVERNQRKRPKRSYRRFSAQFPNQRWQADAFEHVMSSGEQVVVIEIIDDATRYSLGATVAASESSDPVVELFRATIARHGRPALVHTDNSAAFIRKRYKVRTKLEAFLEDLGIKTITGRPTHPQTQGKIERSHQTLQNYLAAHPQATWEELTEVITEYRQWYNHDRAHQSLPPWTTPADLYETLPKACPPGDPITPGPASGSTQVPPRSAAQTFAQAPVMGTRTASARGRIGFGNRKISCGKRYAGVRLHLLGYPDRLEFYDAEGTYLGNLDWPPEGAYPSVAKRLP